VRSQARYRSHLLALQYIALHSNRHVVCRTLSYTLVLDAVQADFHQHLEDELAAYPQQLRS